MFSACWIPCYLHLIAAIILSSNLQCRDTDENFLTGVKKSKGSPYSITEHRVLELIPVLVSQPAGDVSHKPSSRLPLLSTRPAVTPNFTAW